MKRRSYKHYRDETQPAGAELLIEGKILSKSLEFARGVAAFTQALDDLTNLSYEECQEIINLAEELQGDPEASTAYVQARALNQDCHSLRKLLANQVAYVTSNTFADEEASR